MSHIYSKHLLDQEIRLLELQPGSGAQAITTRLITSNLLDHPNFEALSYVWGDQSVRKQISCEGTAITITENLHDALLHLRLQQITRLIWADAICINQYNVEERNHQATLMRHIYHQASRVVVWLGRDQGENLHLAVRAMNLIYQRSLDYAESQNLNMADCDSFEHLQAVKISKNGSLYDAFDENTWSSISFFFKRQWFERIWCAQEIVLARQGIIVSDTCQISWEHVGRAAAVLITQSTQPKHYRSSQRQRDGALQSAFASQLWFHGGKQTILANLETFCNRKATDPRDIVYGLLGLQDYRLADQILEPDYCKSVTEVYIDVVLASANDVNGLQVLSNVQHEDFFRHREGLPSWAPYWPCQRKVSLLGCGKWYAGGHHTIEVSFPTRRELLARGIILEKIISVSDIHPESVDEYGPIHPFPDLMLSLWREYVPSDPSNNFSRTRVEKMCRTLTAGYTVMREVVHELDERQRSIFYSDYLAFIDHILQCTGQRTRTMPLSYSASLNGDWERYSQAVRYACRARRIFRTQGGSLGIGPACTIIGDQVCVLRGVEVPYVLRPANESFWFMGECYIDDIMRGELFQEVGTECPDLTMLSLK